MNHLSGSVPPEAQRLQPKRKTSVGKGRHVRLGFSSRSGIFFFCTDHMTRKSSERTDNMLFAVLNKRQDKMGLKVEVCSKKAC